MDSRRDYFESFAEDWDKNFVAEDMEILSDIINSFNVKPGWKVLDLGCGTGVLFDLLRRTVGPKGLVLGIDFASRMLQKARRNFPFANCLVVDADAAQLPIRPESFDIAISFASFPHFADHPKVMDEIARVLKPGCGFHILHLLSSSELNSHHHNAGGPVAKDHLPPRDAMIRLFDHSHFLNVKITDRPGLYLASGIKA
ncbi:putative UbiE/COQ5 methyltransferase [Candidatus Zixiibacteriota bacterium]|nr:putative UbiE/COQ5 methyltransferase [candidate division Zixibacteria bacterium]